MLAAVRCCLSLNEISLLKKYKKKSEFSNLLIDHIGISLMICIHSIPLNSH